MADTLVILGSVPFFGWEVPEKIPFGSKQRAQIHKLIGGNRVVDAMGPDYEPITWKGRFRGADSIGRAQAVNALCTTGQAVELTWFGLSYTVLVEKFTANTEKFYEVPYEISCIVVDDPLADATSPTGSLDDLVNNDLTTAQGGLSLVSATPVAAIATAVTNAGTLVGAPASAILPITLATNSALTTIDAATTADDIIVAQGMTLASGSYPPTMATSLAAQMAALQDESSLLDTRSYVARIGINLATAGI